VQRELDEHLEQHGTVPFCAAHGRQKGPAFIKEYGINPYKFMKKGADLQQNHSLLKFVEKRLPGFLNDCLPENRAKRHAEGVFTPPDSSDEEEELPLIKPLLDMEKGSAAQEAARERARECSLTEGATGRLCQKVSKVVGLR
jgi:hypothetical protein